MSGWVRTGRIGCWLLVAGCGFSEEELFGARTLNRNQFSADGMGGDALQQGVTGDELFWMDRVRTVA